VTVTARDSRKKIDIITVLAMARVRSPFSLAGTIEA
jgi:hypothetical protein